MQFLRRANDEHSNAPRWACPEQLSKSPGHVPTIQLIVQPSSQRLAVKNPLRLVSYMVSGSPDPAAQSVAVQQASSTLVKGRFTTSLPGTSRRDGQVFHVTATSVFRQNLAAVRKRESAVFAGFPSTGRVWGLSRDFEPLIPI